MTDLTVSIVSHGHGTLVEDLLSDLDALPDAEKLDVILTLNIPETIDLHRFSRLNVLLIRNCRPRGFGTNHNSAFAASKTGWFLILNPDARLAGTVLDDLLAAGRRVERLGAIAPKVVDSAGTVQDSVRANVTPWSLVRRWVFGQRRALATPTVWRAGKDPFLWLAGMCLLVPADSFRAVGGFDERIFLYYEDWDLSARLFLEGYALAYLAETNIVHDARRSSHRSLRYLRWHLGSLFRLWLSRPFRALQLGYR